MRQAVLPEQLRVELVPGFEVADTAAALQRTFGLRLDPAVLLHQRRHPFLPDAVPVGAGYARQGRLALLVFFVDVVGRNLGRPVALLARRPCRHGVERIDQVGMVLLGDVHPACAGREQVPEVGIELAARFLDVVPALAGIAAGDGQGRKSERRGPVARVQDFGIHQGAIGNGQGITGRGQRSTPRPETGAGEEMAFGVTIIKVAFTIAHCPSHTGRVPCLRKPTATKDSRI